MAGMPPLLERRAATRYACSRGVSLMSCAMVAMTVDIEVVLETEEML